MSTDDEVDALLLRLRPILARLRQDGFESVEIALDSFESGMGGVLKVQIPCKNPKRTFPEAAFRTERFNEIG